METKVWLRFFDIKGTDGKSGLVSWHESALEKLDNDGLPLVDRFMMSSIISTF